MKMKNKQAEQAAQRKAQKASLLVKKRSANTIDLGRNPSNRVEKQSFLIVCEGKNTEPDYFRKFKLKTATIKVVGEGYNTISLVQQAKELNEEGEYDQVWCVFDKDDFKNFNNAIQKAEQLSFKVAWSNQAFEYWLLLHFEDHQGGAMDRTLYYDKINAYLKPFNLFYDKDSKRINDRIFDVLQAKDVKNNKKRQELAIARAKRNIQFHKDSTPENSESSTLVFHLVEEILKFV